MRHQTILKTLIISLVISLFLLSPVSAKGEMNLSPVPKPVAEYALPFPGLLPTHPLYFIKNLRDRFLILTTADPIRKSELFLLLSDKNLAMGIQLWNEQKKTESIKAFKQGENYMFQSVQKLIETKKTRTLPPGLIDKVELSSKKHEELVRGIIDSSTDSGDQDQLKEVLALVRQARSEISISK
jgi:hypothetical protein